jgi:hypothetical protein
LKRVLEEKEFKEIEDYRPTVGVNISLYEYKGSEEVMVSAFDCGGQTSFIDAYVTDQWVPTLFGKVSIFLFLVDSSSNENLENATKLFHKNYENVRMNSPDAETYILATKWDKRTISLTELREAFKDVKVYPVSVLDGSTVEVSEDIISNFLGKRGE